MTFRFTIASHHPLSMDDNIADLFLTDGEGDQRDVVATISELQHNGLLIAGWVENADDDDSRSTEQCYR